MGRSKHKHRQEKRRRHRRQIEEGTRQPKARRKKPKAWSTKFYRIRRRVKLSELNRDDVRKILELVKNLDLDS